MVVRSVEGDAMVSRAECENAGFFKQAPEIANLMRRSKNKNGGRCARGDSILKERGVGVVQLIATSRERQKKRKAVAKARS